MVSVAIYDMMHLILETVNFHNTSRSRLNCYSLELLSQRNIVVKSMDLCYTTDMWSTWGERWYSINHYTNFVRWATIINLNTSSSNALDFECQHNSAEPIYLFSTEENAQESTKITFDEFGPACDWVSQLIHLNPIVLQHQVILLSLVWTGFVVSSRQCLFLMND